MRDKEISEGLGDMAHMAEKDHEVQMARADLYKIAKYSIKLHEMLKSVSEAEGLEGWVQSKITKAADYLGSVYHHMDYEQVSGELGEARDTHCSDKCCGSDVKAEDCTCPPTCKHCNCNAKNVNEAKACNCNEDCACGGNCGPDCNCGPECGSVTEGKFKSAAHRKAVHAAKASGKKKKKGLGERLDAKLAEKKAGIDAMIKAGSAKADAEAEERRKKKD
jgi:hypothetical protein